MVLSVLKRWVKTQGFCQLVLPMAPHSSEVTEEVFPGLDGGLGFEKRLEMPTKVNVLSLDLDNGSPCSLVCTSPDDTRFSGPTDQIFPKPTPLFPKGRTGVIF